MAINRENREKVDDPLFLYQYNAGFVRNSESKARKMLDKANGILKYIATDGNGTSNEYTLNTNSIFPKSPEPEDYNSDDLMSGSSEKTYKRGMIAFNLLISKEGIKQIIFSTPQRILKAYLNMMKEFDEYLVKKFSSLFKVVKDKNGRDKVEIDTREIDYDENYSNTVDILTQMAYTATNLIKDIFSIRNEYDSKKQAEKLVKIASGKGSSNLGYDKFMKVIVQLVSKENIAGNIYISTEKKIKGEEDVNATYQVDPNNEVSGTLKEINSVRERFSAPLTLKD
ncbi:MAG: hypothetical protein K6357_06170 [Elusimicrobiota bacterium]